MDETIPMEAAHADSGFTCDECGRTFQTRPSLTAHRRFKHEGPPSAPAAKTSKAAKKDRPPAAPASGSRGPGRPRARRSLKADLMISYGFGAQFWAMRDPVCGSVAMAQVETIAESWDHWAATSPRVQAALEKAMAGSGALGVLLAHAPLIVIVMQHHGPQKDLYFPPVPMGPPAPPAPPPVDNQKVPADWGFGEATWENAGPVASGYAPGSADNAR